MYEYCMNRLGLKEIISFVENKGQCSCNLFEE